jgi:hypothetical protein
MSKDFWVVANQSYAVDALTPYLRYVVRGHCSQRFKTAFFCASYLEEDDRYIVREVDNIGGFNDYETISL